MKTPPHILQAIQSNLEQEESILDFRGQALLQVPEEIKELTHLEHLLLKDNAIQTLPEWLNDLPQLEFIQLNINPLHEVGRVRHLVLDWGVWWRLQPDPQQVVGLWLRWEEGEMLVFLTKRSLYALVADTREERTNFYDWLSRVELFSDNSPVFIVKNQKDERAVKLGEPSLKERFHQSLKAVFDCNLSNNRGRAEMLAFLQYQIQQLPYVGQALPKTWLKVREQLEQVGATRPYIAQQEYVSASGV